MEASTISSELGEGGVMMFSKASSSPPKLILPPRTSAEAILRGPDGVSPSPMTFVSSLFAEDPYSDHKFFSRFLAGDMASPTAHMNNGFSDLDVDGGLASPGSARPNHTARFRLMMPSKLPIRRSPCITIPPGLSPTTLLDSPVLFSTGQCSPTTGTYQMPSVPQEGGSAGALGYNTLNLSSEQGGSPTFVFKPHPQFPMPPIASMALVDVQAQAQSETGAFKSTSKVPSMAFLHGPNLLLQSQASVDSTVEPVTEPLEKVSSSQALDLSHPLPHLIERPSEDGYNWRKYGQKQVKGSEYPRSYYKCTYASCHVKKKVERSYDGQITEIVYKGEHNHPKPQATRRLAREASHLATLESAEGSSTDPSLAKGQLPFSNRLSGTPEPSVGSTSDDETEDGVASKAEDGGEDDPDFKRRKIEKANEPLANAPLRTVREPRVVVQTTSDVDILDDGYRWRKYGQKVVKGNAHPRSYYKCTTVGCLVRKHVERSSADFKAVITTYEGKHNHDVPAPRNGHHDASATNATASALPRVGGSAHDTNAFVKPAISLQEQVLGKNKLSAGGEPGSGGPLYGAWISEQSSAQRGEGKSAMNMVGRNPSGARHLEGGEFFWQGGLIPKLEPGDVHPVGGPLQPTYQPGQSTFFAPRTPS